MKYARKSAIVEVEFAEENGLVTTWSGDIPYFKGDAITTNEFGEVNVWSRQVFEDNFVPIQKVEIKQHSQLSPFEEQYISAYANYTGEELNQKEDEDYISSLQEMVTNKEF